MLRLNQVGIIIEVKMLEIKKGDILKSEVEALVNTVNCVGVMGRGIALQFKKAFPENFKQYEKACKNEQIVPGKMFIVDLGKMFNPRYIINFPTKRHWQANSQIQDIKDGLKSLVDDIKNYGIKSIAIPPLGCGLGGLNWQEVYPLIEKSLGNLSEEVKIYIYPPNGAPAIDQLVKEKKQPNMTIGRACLIVLMREYQKAVMDPYITLLEVQKLMYFMQIAGEPLKLRYKKAPYGPYAENLKNVLTLIEGHFISGYGDGGDNPEKPLTIQHEAVSQSINFIEKNTDTKQRLEKVNTLIQGFENSYGMELLASVHWIAEEKKTHDTDIISKALHEWNSRKKMFQHSHIKIALERLVSLGWI